MSPCFVFLIFFLIRSSNGCSEPANSFCDSSFTPDDTFYVAEQGSDTQDCSISNPCGTLQRAISRATGGVVILVHPGLYTGVEQSIPSIQTNISIQCVPTAQNDSCIFDLKGNSRFLTRMTIPEDNVFIELVGLVVKNGFVSGENGGLIMTGNVSCLNIENCSFVSDAETLQCDVGKALALYNTRVNLRNTVFDFVSDTDSSIVYVEGLYPENEPDIAVTVYNVTFLEKRSEVEHSMVGNSFIKRTHSSICMKKGVDHWSDNLQIDLYLSNLTNVISIQTLYELNRQIEKYYVCVYIVSPEQINSILINNSEVAIGDVEGNPVVSPILIDYIYMFNEFSALLIYTDQDIEIERFDWSGGYFSLTRTVVISGTSNWDCHINAVCTPAWNPSFQFHDTAIRIKEDAILTMTGYFVPHSQTSISFENHGWLHINHTELIKFDSITNFDYLKLEGDFPFLRLYNQTDSGSLNLVYGELAPWYVAYLYLDGMVWLSFSNKDHECPSHNTSTKIIRYYYSEGNPDPYIYDGVNFTLKQVNGEDYWSASFVDIACKHLSCDCETCRTSSKCVYCVMSHSCIEETDSRPLSDCPIQMKHSCCPNDCNGYSCDKQIFTCQCPPMFGGFDCTEFHWWVVLTAVSSSGIITSIFVILVVYKCCQRYTRHKLRNLRDHLEEQHNCYVDRLQNRQVPPSLIIDFKEIKIKRQVGCGSFGEVYEGKWRNSIIAVKKIRIHSLGLSQEEKEEFQQEAAIMSKLLHPNIVLLMGVCIEVPNLCLITEFMQMGSVREILDNHSVDLKWRTKIVMALDAARGMTYLHGVTPPVIHRDLKTPNLLVDHNWKVKVADFGVAKMIKDIDYMVSVLSNSLVNMPTLEAATQANETSENCTAPLLHRQAEQFNTTCAGSIRWCAPESMKPKLAATVYGQKVDIYSYGVILWELATREWPYVDLKFDFEVMEHVLKGGRLPVPTNCPRQFLSLIQDCWNQDSRYRPWFPDIVNILDDMLDSFT